MKTVVRFERVIKKLRFLPPHVRDKAQEWGRDVEKFGLPEMRKIPGLHDEPLSGKRLGQRSIRLSKSYRLFYVEIETTILIVEVMEINKHEY